MSLEHRLVVPPHGAVGSPFGSEAEFENYAAYLISRIRGGIQWVGGGPTFVANPLVPGFEPTGVGAHGPGLFRTPNFVPRLGALMERIHTAGGYASVQFVQQGAMPSAPSATLSGYADHKIPHVLDLDEVRWLVREYGQSAALAAEAGVDAIELHANHDDVLQLFLSPLTNRRTDAYGGSFENRRRYLREVVESIRDHVNRPITLGLRLCLDELIDGGYDIEECQRLLAAFTADGTVDYFSLDIGGNWAAVSYIPATSYEEGQWAELCGQAKTATDLPVIYVGRVTYPETAEKILAAGQADLVGFVRATMADPEFVNKAAQGREAEIRPCIGLMECITRRVVENLPFACGVNPHAGREVVLTKKVAAPKKVLVIGGGPAGTEVAALAAERGHQVSLWERNTTLGGQLNVAKLARMNAKYGEWMTWQEGRLGRLGVDVVVAKTATVDDVLAAGADIVVVATGATPRLSDAAGVDLDHVVTAAAALGGAPLGRRVLVVSEDDRAAPLVVAEHLAGLGHEVTLTYRTTAPSPLVGKYNVGAILGRLDAHGVVLMPMTRLVEVRADAVVLANVYSNRRFERDGFDSVVLACGSVPDDSLFVQLKSRHPRVHLLGDAFAPLRVVSATRQAFALAQSLERAVVAIRTRRDRGTTRGRPR